MELLLPRDGSIVIIDDKYSEAKPLIDLLSENGYPSIYFNGDITKCPSGGLRKVRAVFADIQLYQGLNDQLYAQLILDHLDKLIPSKSEPYILMIWSAKLTAYAQKLEEMVNAPTFSKKPIAIIRLDKNDYFKKATTENDLDKEAFLESLETRFSENDRNYILNAIEANLQQNEVREIKQDALTRISGKITRALKNYKAFEWLIGWETSISESAACFAGDLAEIHPKNSNWDSNFRNIIARLAHAQVGDVIKKLRKKDFIRLAFKTMNSAFSDSIDKSATFPISLSNSDFTSYRESGYTVSENNSEYKIMWKDYSHYELHIDGTKRGNDRNSIIDLVKNVNNNNTQKIVVDQMVKAYKGFNPELNARLNVDFVTKKPFQPGILYEVKVARKRKRALLNDTYFKDEAFTKRTGAQNQYSIPDTAMDQFRFVELEISPNCDFANDKWKKHRVISGILYPKDLEANHNLSLQKDQSLYEAFPVIKINGEVFKLLLSFKLLKSFDLIDSDEKLRTVILRIKNEPMADIITRMTSHANRIGLIEFF